MKFLGPGLLIIGLLLLLLSGMTTELSSGTEFSVGYMSNGQYVPTDHGVINRDSDGLEAGETFRGIGIASLVLGGGITVVSLFQKKDSDENDY